MVDSPPDDARSRILASATHLFAAHGVSGTSIQAVAADAGLTRPTLVYHFKSKPGLRDAVLAQIFDHWSRELPRMMAAAATGGPRLDTLIEALFDFFLRDPTRARVLMREILDRPDELRALLREHLQPLTVLLTQAIRVGQQADILKPRADPEAYTVLVVTSALGVVAVGAEASALVGPEPTVDALRAELIRVARAALLRKTDDQLLL